MEKNYFTILFFIRKSIALKNGEVPIYLRITIDGKRSEMLIKRSVNPNQWNSIKECATGKNEKCNEINMFLETIRAKVLRIVNLKWRKQKEEKMLKVWQKFWLLKNITIFATLLILILKQQNHGE